MLEELLPRRGTSMSEDELGQVVGQIVESTQGAKEEGMKALGRIIKAVREQVGDRAEGKEIADAVRKALSG